MKYTERDEVYCKCAHILDASPCTVQDVINIMTALEDVGVLVVFAPLLTAVLKKICKIVRAPRILGPLDFVQPS